MKKKLPQQMSASDGPFTYTYLAVMSVPGIHLDKVDGNLPIFSFADLNATAILTQDWDRYSMHMDRSSAIGLLMFTGFRGLSRFKWLSSWSSAIILRLFGAERHFRISLGREQRKALLARHKERKTSGCYLVYHAEGDLVQPPDFRSASRFDRIGFGFDIVDGGIYRSIHKSALHGSATALSLMIDKWNGFPEINEIADIVFLTGRDGIIVYPKRIEVGGASIVVSRAPSREDLNDLATSIPLIAADKQIETAISLFVQSHRKDGDNLRSFIPAWSALELLVNRLSKIVRPEWERLLKEGNLPAWDKDLTQVSTKDYRMRDRFYSVACTLIREDASEDCERFSQANDLRSGYYHKSAVKEKDLPTHDARVLFRKYLTVALRYQKPDNHAK